MYTISNFQEAVQQGTGMGGYVWVALIIFFLMVFLGWLVSSKGWLKKEEAPAAAGHAPASTDHAAPESHATHAAEPQHLESAHGIIPPSDWESPEHGASASTAQEDLHGQPAQTELLSSEPAPARKALVPSGVEAAPEAKESAPDDLTILEGIGPKVAKVLAGAGITTFDGLAKAEFSRVRAALDAAGYKYMEPAGWIEQAAVAARGDMQGLKKLQGELKGGRRIP